MKMKPIATAPKNLLYFAFLVRSLTMMSSVVALEGAPTSTTTATTATTLSVTTPRDLLQQSQQEEETTSSTVERKLHDCHHPTATPTSLPTTAPSPSLRDLLPKGKGAAPKESRPSMMPSQSRGAATLPYGTSEVVQQEAMPPSLPAPKDVVPKGSRRPSMMPSQSLPQTTFGMQGIGNEVSKGPSFPPPPPKGTGPVSKEPRPSVMPSASTSRPAPSFGTEGHAYDEEVPSMQPSLYPTWGPSELPTRHPTMDGIGNEVSKGPPVPTPPPKGTVSVSTEPRPSVMPSTSRPAPSYGMESQAYDDDLVEPEEVPSMQPSLYPTWGPTELPTRHHTNEPTTLLAPSVTPSYYPTYEPTREPTLPRIPTFTPSLRPAVNERPRIPTLTPSLRPAVNESFGDLGGSDSNVPSLVPTFAPSTTRVPTFAPSASQPTMAPSKMTEEPTSSLPEGNGKNGDDNAEWQPTAAPTTQTIRASESKESSNISAGTVAGVAMAGAVVVLTAILVTKMRRHGGLSRSGMSSVMTPEDAMILVPVGSCASDADHIPGTDDRHHHNGDGGDVDDGVGPAVGALPPVSSEQGTGPISEPREIDISLNSNINSNSDHSESKTVSIPPPWHSEPRDEDGSPAMPFVTAV